MVWPASSPDMSPFEHLWDVVDPPEILHLQIPRNWVTIQMAWLNIPPDVFRPLVEAMLRQVAALRQARGGPTLD